MDGPTMYTIKWSHLAHLPSKGKGCKGSERGVCWVCSIWGSLVAVWQDPEKRAGDTGPGRMQDFFLLLLMGIHLGTPYILEIKSLFNPFKNFKTSF